MAKKAVLTIKPVGGVGQIGSNMTLIQGEKDTIIIDAGILFRTKIFSTLIILFLISHIFPSRAI